MIDRKKIAKKYMKSGQFFIDLIASIPMDLIIIIFEVSDFLSLIKLFKLVRILRISKII